MRRVKIQRRPNPDPIVGFFARKCTVCGKRYYGLHICLEPKYTNKK